MRMARRKYLTMLSGVVLCIFASLAASAAQPEGGRQYLKLPDIIVFFEKAEGQEVIHYLNAKLMMEFATKEDMDFFRVRSTEVVDLLKVAFRMAGYQALKGGDGVKEMKKIATEALSKMAGAPPSFEILVVDVMIM